MASGTAGTADGRKAGNGPIPSFQRRRSAACRIGTARIRPASSRAVRSLRATPGAPAASKHLRRQIVIIPASHVNAAHKLTVAKDRLSRQIRWARAPIYDCRKQFFKGWIRIKDKELPVPHFSFVGLIKRSDVAAGTGPQGALTKSQHSNGGG